MIEAAIRARIKSAAPTFKSVRDGIALAALSQTTTLSFPLAFVLTVGELGAADYGMVGSTGQRRIQRVAVVLAVRNVRDATGGEIKADIEALRSQVDTALFGWQPSPEHEPLVFRHGALLEFKDATLWWQDEYETAYQRRTV